MVDHGTTYLKWVNYINIHSFWSYKIKLLFALKVKSGNRNLLAFSSPSLKEMVPFLSYLFLVFFYIFSYAWIHPVIYIFCSFLGDTFGRGIYFSRDVSYSLAYALAGVGGRRYVYLARVLVGQYCVGNTSMKVPPPKNPSRLGILYESVVDNRRNPSIFVVFYDNQCYPEYLITVKK